VVLYKVYLDKMDKLIQQVQRSWKFYLYKQHQLHIYFLGYSTNKHDLHDQDSQSSIHYICFLVDTYKPNFLLNLFLDNNQVYIYLFEQHLQWNQGQL